MLAYRRSGDDGYIEFECDVNDKGEPILPVDATITPPPEHKDGYSRTIREGEWIYVKVPEPPKPTVEELRPYKEMEFKNWETEYLGQPFILNGYVFKNDERAREMINTSISAFREWGELPKFWLTADNKLIQDVTKEFLDDLGKKAYGTYQDNMLTAIVIGKSISTAKTPEELEAIEFPKPNTVESLIEELQK